MLYFQIYLIIMVQRKRRRKKSYIRYGIEIEYKLFYSELKSGFLIVY